jgi:hypothetical protein
MYPFLLFWGNAIAFPQKEEMRYIFDFREWGMGKLFGDFQR